MSYTPNIDGAVHFVNDVMPLVWARRPSARVQIVGKDPAAEVLALAGDRVQVTGGVPDVRPYLDRATLTVVPLRSGGGTRLKLLEAMSAGAPIVSTTLGAEGLGLEHGHEAWLATDAAGLGLGVLTLMSDPDRARAMAAAARARAERDLSWDRVGARLADLLGALEGGASPA
jgi:glycosyltransferase involved in cell wall biosynthesis